jgi:hypothetical protein
MINWPVPSFIGEIYTAPNGKSWKWNGYAWDFIGPDGLGTLNVVNPDQ